MKGRWPSQDSQTAAQIANFDWTTTSLGPIDGWPQSLRTAVDLMLDSAQPAYIAWGEELTSLFNDGYIPILGEKYPDAIGQPYSRLFREIWEEYRSLVDATLTGKSHSFIDQPVALLGRGLPMSWFTFSWTPLRDESGTIRGIYCAAFETTKKVRAEEDLHTAQEDALQLSEERYRTLFDSIDDGFCIIEMLFDDRGRPYDYRFLEANPAFGRHTGLHDAIGHTVKEFAPEHEQHWFDIYGRVATTGEPVRFQNRAQDIDNRWYDVFAFRVGRPEQFRVATLFTDISARKNAEDALQDANRRKDEFLATLAHELRNPLAPLRNGLHIARLTRRTDEGLRVTLDMMDRQLSHLVRLVDDLLDVGRISSGKLELKQEPLELGLAVAAGVESIRASVEAAHHHLTIDATPEPIWVKGDRDRLAQIFTNLLSNAVKYTETGGRIDVLLKREGEEALVCVSDSGIGIPSAAIGNVFDLFSQVREHQLRYGGGLGIGLALVKQLVTLHGGTVHVRSAGEGQGSSFAVRLPVIPSPHEAERHLDAPEAVVRSRKRVLIADDNEDAAESLALMLRFLGHEVWTAKDGQEALDTLKQASPDYIFLDIGMPVLDGIEAARRIRATPGFDKVNLVAVTGWGQDSDRERTSKAGFNMHLVKPVNPREVERLLA